MEVPMEAPIEPLKHKLIGHFLVAEGEQSSITTSLSKE